MRIRTSYEGPLGDHFAHRATDSPYNAHTDRPAVLALAVRGFRRRDL